jgi:hypothetical protein
MSLAQFRPEKQQNLQLYVLSELLKLSPKKKIILKICGTTRGHEDEAILAKLKDLSKELKMYPIDYDRESNVQFVVNQPYPKII